MKIVYLDKNLYCTRIAYVWDGELWGFNAEDKSLSRYVSNIYKGKIVRVVAGLDAVFVDLGGSKTGFLPVETDISKYKEGNYVLCQVKRDYFGNKDVAMREDISIASKYAIYLPNGKGISVSKKLTPERKAYLLNLFEESDNAGGIILRTACQKADDIQITEDIDRLKQKWEDIHNTSKHLDGAGLVYRELNLCDRLKRDELYDIDKIITNDYEVYSEFKNKAEFFNKEYDLFDYYGLREEIEGIVNKKVDLPNGGSLVFEYSEACTFIDVNTSKNIGKNDAETTIFNTNLIAAREIIRQLALRNVSGAILVDFISMKSAQHNEELLAAINAYSNLDKVSTTVLGMTKLGFVEITRRKSDKLRDVALLDICKSCNGTGKIFRAEYALCRILGKLTDIYRENRPNKLSIMISARLQDAIVNTLFLEECKRRFPNVQIHIILDESMGNTDYRIQI